MNEDLEQLLHNLKLKTIAARFMKCSPRGSCRHPGAHPSSPSIACRVARPSGKKPCRRASDRADFPEPWTLESFPFKMQKGVKDARSAPRRTRLHPQAENIVFIGKPASAKPG